ncbi:A-kinase anchor protein 1, mitochondrial [Elgaria multicarinata webbii]|uniref:A-kinase anchor protein 1, mitochondrial n=1 Tax=Elgaria multicarinata webbii TaxID=159646 RepID=UPI002FCCCC58
MALRFRTLLPFAIPGVLALIGWWWFSARKKERASNHDRRDPAGLEERRIGSLKRDPCSREDSQLDNELSASREAARATRAFEPLAERRAVSVERSAQSLASSRGDLPVAAKATIGSDAHRDDSEKLEVMGCPGVFASPVLEASPLDAQVAASPQLQGKRCSAQVTSQVPSATSTAALSESPCLEKSGAMVEDTALQNDPSEESLKEEQGPVASEVAPSPTVCSEVANKVVLVAPLGGTEIEEMNGGTVGEVELRVPAHKCVAPASFELGQEVEASSVNTGSTLMHHGFGDLGRKSGSEKERIGGVTLDKEEVEKIEQVAIHIISNVIRAATEEVLSGSGSDVSDRLCQMAARADKSLEKTSAGAVDPAEPCKGSECLLEKVAAVELTPLLEENVQRHAMFSSHLTHGRLGNPSFGQPRDSVHAEQTAGDPVANHEEFEDAHTVTEDSGCSACTSEDGASAEELLKSTSSPALGQRLDLLNMPAIKDSEYSSASSKKPACSALTEDKVPYSNGMVKEGCLPLGTEQPWPAEMDGDHSGGSDVNSMDSVDSDCALRKNGSCPNSKTGADPSKTELVIWEIEVPKHLVGRLIGKQGRYVSFLKQASGAKIYISTLPYTQDFQICHIEGSQQNVDKALGLIGKKFKDLSLTNIYAPPPPPLPLHSLPMTSWLMLPDGVTVEVIVVNQVNAGHLFVQQHTHPTFHVLRSLDQQMYLCYSQPGIPTMPTPVEVGVVCAAPGVEGAWWRAQVVGYFKDTSEVEIRYVDYGGYERVKIDTLRQIRSDFVTLPFQGAEVLLDNVVPLPDDDHFSSEADTAVSEMTRGTPLLAQVTNYDNATGLPLIQLWSMIGDELVSINRTLVERGFAQWVENY